ncbi:hypothetical protein SNE510_64980 [Streptomyces sp. NE5-10]|nr:hypothetical protein SNE510_64980 [Streptomyces sp. NE5-10]
MPVPSTWMPKKLSIRDWGRGAEPGSPASGSPSGARRTVLREASRGGRASLRAEPREDSGPLPPAPRETFRGAACAVLRGGFTAGCGSFRAARRGAGGVTGTG